MTINCKGNLIDLTTPKVMGILNITPDSFYDGGKFRDKASILRHTETMLEEGASFIDVGAYSSRPGAEDIPLETELNRILPVITALLDAFPGILLSVDTFRSDVARHCLEHGAAIINDISAGELDQHMMSTVAEFKVPYCLMHLRGTPQTMAKQNTYTDLVTEVLYYFSEKVARARTLGISDLLIDPGFGFAKIGIQNYELLRNLDRLRTLGLPILVGLSRKSMISKIVGTDSANSLNGTTALNMYALQKGANILRVHDVKEAMECITLLGHLSGQND